MDGSGGTLQEGIRLFRMKRWDLALKEFLSIDTEKFDTGENIELAYYLGLCYTKQSRFDDALLYLEQVVTSGQDVLRIYQCRMTLAYIYVMTKRSRMAEFELKRLQNNGLSRSSFTPLWPMPHGCKRTSRTRWISTKRPWTWMKTTLPP
jgi:tetratricopeptide (TPR) repeat protein